MPQGAVAAGVADAGAEPLEARQACIHQTHGPSERVGRLAASLLQYQARAADNPARLINSQRRQTHAFCGGGLSSFRFTRDTSDNYDRKGLDPKLGIGLASKNIGMMHPWTCLS